MACDCDCIYLDWQSTFEGGNSGGAQYDAAGTFLDCNYFEVDIDSFTYFIFKKNADWVLSDSLGGVPIQILEGDYDCPCGVNGFETPPETPIFPYEVKVAKCDYLDCCFNVSIVEDATEVQLFNSYQFQATFDTRFTIYNCAPLWQWVFDDTAYQLVLNQSGDDCVWEFRSLSEVQIGATIPTGRLLYSLETCGCPISTNWIGKTELTVSFATADCSVGCVPIQDRYFEKFDAIKLPQIFVEEDRGFKICCDCPMLVLAGGDTDSWKNDVTSAWIKLSSPSDSATFELLKDGQPVAYAPPVYSFPNEDNAFYTTIPWRDVLASDGIGCYELKVSYDISGLIGGFTWGKYNLRPYSIQNALKTARIRVKLNLKQSIEGINFTGANVEDCVRFYGFIGERQPNTEIDNLIYQDRTMKSVIRENLDTYIITTDPLLECFIRPMTDLWLLSENEMFISDYNRHNHSYRIQDVPVILEESPEIDYLDILQRRAKLVATVGIKSKNRRTYY